MSPAAVRQTKAAELHGEVLHATKESRDALDRALLTAWRTGRTLLEERSRIRRTMGRGAWRHWLAENFRPSELIATRYLKLASTVDDPDDLRRLSLRQAYFRLGVPTEPKIRATSRRLPGLPKHVRPAQRLLLSVRMRLRVRPMTDEQRKHLYDDLRPLHQQLCALFASEPPRRQQMRVAK